MKKEVRVASPYWVKTLINKTFSWRFFLSKLTRQPFLGRMTDKFLFDGDDMIYLPRNRVIPIDETVDAAHASSAAVPSMVLDHFIREAGFIWKMDFCICRDSTGCKDYPASFGCLFLGKAARGINAGFGRSIGVAEALEYAALCREAGLVHLVGRGKFDSIWLNAHPAHQLLTVCHCCPCCCLWKMLPVIDKRISRKVHRMPGIRLHVTDLCTGCGICTRNVCFADAIHLHAARACIDDGNCRGCGRCADACPQQAIRVEIARPDYITATVKRISSVVDVSEPAVKNPRAFQS